MGDSDEGEFEQKAAASGENAEDEDSGLDDDNSVLDEDEEDYEEEKD